MSVANLHLGELEEPTVVENHNLLCDLCPANLVDSLSNMNRLFPSPSPPVTLHGRERQSRCSAVDAPLGVVVLRSQSGVAITVITAGPH